MREETAAGVQAREWQLETDFTPIAGVLPTPLLSAHVDLTKHPSSASSRGSVSRMLSPIS